MMMTQLATVAIKASVRVSLATVPPKFVMRSKSRSRSLARVSCQLIEQCLGDVGLEVGAEDELGSGGGGGRSVSVEASASGPTISNRDGWIGDLGAFEDLGEDSRNNLGRRLRAVKGRGVEVEFVLAVRRQIGGPRPAPSWTGRRPPGCGAIGLPSV